MKWWKIARLVIAAVRAAVDETKEAKEADSDGGKKVTTEEALEIARHVLSTVKRKGAGAKGSYSETTRKRAQFVVNASKWKRR